MAVSASRFFPRSGEDDPDLVNDHQHGHERGLMGSPVGVAAAVTLITIARRGTSERGSGDDADRRECHDHRHLEHHAERSIATRYRA
jgi:hypothetical protein